MAINTAFNPAWKNAQTVTTGATTASIQIGKGSESLVITNTGANPAYISVGPSTVTATNTDFLVLSGTQVIIGKDKEHTHVAPLQITGATTLHVLPGEGL